jgi:hypothetical protein
MIPCINHVLTLDEAPPSTCMRKEEMLKTPVPLIVSGALVNL